MEFNVDRPLLAALALFLVAPHTEAASVFLSPDNSVANIADGSVTVELFMDFSDDATLGGGIDLTVSSGIAIESFSPSDYFNNVPDPFFTGFGTDDADGDFEVHFGDFAGLSGLNKLGDLQVTLLETGAASITMAINSTYGEFFNLDGALQDVALLGADIQVVPVPAAFWLMGSGLAALATFRRKRSMALT